MELRGYDHYEVTLGDEMRGERASMGRTLAEVEAELRIKAPVLQAIEDCDLTGFPNRSVVSGYVRSYARYLGMDAEEVYRRFCAESGFVPPNAAISGDRSGRGPVYKRLGNSPFDESRFAVQPAQTRFAARVPLGSLASALALLGLIAGLSYGGYALLQNIQRVGFAPLPEAPEVVAEAPRISAPDYTRAALSRPDADAYGEDGPLAAVYAPDDQPPILRRDGPISEIDPGATGAFAAVAQAPAIATNPPEPQEAVAAKAPPVDSADDVIQLSAARLAQIRSDELAMAKRVEAMLPEEPEPPKGIAIHAVNEAWIRVRNADRAIIFEGLLQPGERYTLPDRVVRGQLRAGNAGDVYIIVNGEPFGPVGRPGGVVKNLSLAAVDVRESFERADPGRFGPPPEDAVAEQRAEAD